MSLLGRRRVPLETPLSIADGMTISDPRLLRNSRAAAERAEFLKAAVERLEAGPRYGEAAYPIVAELVAMLPVNQNSRETLCESGVRSAAMGLAVADEEQARGWARQGQVDAVVKVALDWDLHKGAMQANGDWIAGTVATYMLNVAYYIARTGPAGMAAVQSGMRRFAQAVATDEAKNQPLEKEPPPPEPPRPNLESISHQSWAIALEEAKDRRVLECLHGESDLQHAYGDWCEKQNLPEVVVRGPYRLASREVVDFRDGVLGWKSP